MFKNFKRSPSSSNPSQKIKFTNDQLAGGFMRQGGDASSRTSPSPLQLVAVNTNNKSLPRRQASLRHSTYFGGSAALAYHPLAASPAPPQIGLSAKPVNTTKKYVSCDNIMGEIKNGSVSSSSKKLYQTQEEHEDVGIDVIDELPMKKSDHPIADYEEFDDDDDDDENGIKEKLAKRYNSLTSLLMKSFRKAKQKKKEQMQRMMGATSGSTEVASMSAGEVKLIERTNFEDRSEYRHHQAPVPMPRTTTGTKLNNECKILSSSLVSQTPSVYTPRRGSVKSNSSAVTAPATLPLFYEKGVSEEDEEEGGESLPVFIGAKVISNEFVDLEKSEVQQQVINEMKASIMKSNSEINKALSDEAILDKLIEKKLKSLNQIRANSNMKLSLPESTDSSDCSSVQTIKKMESPKKESELNSGGYSELNRTILNGINDSVILKKPAAPVANQNTQQFSSHLKPQAPRVPPPEPSQSPQRCETLKQDPAPDESQSIEMASQSPLTNSSTAIRRTKTFTQQLQDILNERKSIRQQQQQVQPQPQPPTCKSPTPYPPATPNTSSNKIPNIKEIIDVNNLNKMRKYYSNLDYLDSAQAYLHDYQLELRKINEANMSQYDIHRTHLDSQIFQYDDLRLKSKPSVEQSVEIRAEKHEMLTSPQAHNSTISDDFKELVHVLGRQDNPFKKKFFDCLMSKLWDTTLPYDEYYQLNKLMTALFGENYHKMDNSAARTISGTSSGQQTPRTTRLDAEHVVSLVRAYLDQTKIDDVPQPSASSEFQLNSIPKNSTPSIDSYSSVSNLIMTLKRRKKQLDRTEASSVNAMNIFQKNDFEDEKKASPNGSQNYDNNKFSYLNGFETHSSLLNGSICESGSVAYNNNTNTLSNKKPSANQQAQIPSLLVTLEQKEDEEEENQQLRTYMSISEHQQKQLQQQIKQQIQHQQIQIQQKIQQQVVDSAPGISASQVIKSVTEDPEAFARTKLRRTVANYNNLSTSGTGTGTGTTAVNSGKILVKTISQLPQPESNRQSSLLTATSFQPPQVQLQNMKLNLMNDPSAAMIALKQHQQKQIQVQQQQLQAKQIQQQQQQIHQIQQQQQINSTYQRRNLLLNTWLIEQQQQQLRPQALAQIEMNTTIDTSTLTREKTAPVNRVLVVNPQPPKPKIVSKQTSSGPQQQQRAFQIRNVKEIFSPQESPMHPNRGQSNLQPVSNLKPRLNLPVVAANRMSSNLVKSPSRSKVTTASVRNVYEMVSMVSNSENMNNLNTNNLRSSMMARRLVNADKRAMYKSIYELNTPSVNSRQHIREMQQAFY